MASFLYKAGFISSPYPTGLHGGGGGGCPLHCGGLLQGEQPGAREGPGASGQRLEVQRECAL